MVPVIAKDNIQLTLLPQKKGKKIAIFFVGFSRLFLTLSLTAVFPLLGHSIWCKHKGTYREY
jgi:hypothetical protein